MNEHLFWSLIVCGVAFAVLSGLWWADVGDVRSTLRSVGGAVGALVLLCLLIAIGFGSIYAIVSVVRYAWSGS